VGRTEQAWVVPAGWQLGRKAFLSKNEKGKQAAALFFQFFKQRFDFKSQGFKYF
jgi:hypothetical protein